MENRSRMMEQLPIGMALTDISGKILEANQAAQDLLGFESREAFLSTPMLDLYVDDGQRAKLLAEIQANGKVETKVALRANGRIEMFNIKAVLFHSPGTGVMLTAIWKE